MIAHHTVYFDHLQHAIQSGSLSKVQSALAEIRADHLAKLIHAKRVSQELAGTKSHGLLLTQALVDVRGREDITPLMLACVLYREKALRKEEQAKASMDAIAEWLLQEQASVWAEGNRPPVARVNRNSGQQFYVRGRGCNILEALGWANLPPSVQEHIKRRGNVELAERDYEWAA